MKAEITCLAKKNLAMIADLWNRLRLLHIKDSLYFKEHLENLSFKKRCEKFNNIDEEDFLLEVVKTDSQIIAYCISTIQKEVGEIDSLFIEEQYRSEGWGSRLAQNTKDWFKRKKCKRSIVSVSAGHEEVFGFYQSLGFYPRHTYLELKE